MNTAEKAGNVLNWFNGDEPGPHTVELIPTNGCNLNCLSCRARERMEYQPEEELSRENIVRLVNEAAALGVRYFHISGGGEPLFRFGTTIAAICLIKNLGRECSMVTNGTLFTPESIAHLVKIGMDEVIFSIDGPDAETHDYLRGVKGSFERSVKNLRLFAYWKRKLGKTRPILAVAPVISSRNYDKIGDMLNLARCSGADQLMVQLLTVKPNKIGKKLMLSQSQESVFMEKLGAAREMSGLYGIQIIPERIDRESVEDSSHMEILVQMDSQKHNDHPVLSIPCYSPWFFMNIQPDGCVEPCGVSGDSSENIKTKSLHEIWHGEYFTSFRKGLMRKEIPERCKKCCAMSVLGMTRGIRDELSRLM